MVPSVQPIRPRQRRGIRPCPTWPPWRNGDGDTTEARALWLKFLLECPGDLEALPRVETVGQTGAGLLELLRRVAGDPAAARAKGVTGSEHTRRNFTRHQSALAVEHRLIVLSEMRDQPRINTDEHGWGMSIRYRREASGKRFPSRDSADSLISDPCSSVSIRGSSSSGRMARISLTMIERDEQENLPPCLSSVAGLFDEVVVVDTGSKDRTAGDRPRVRGAACSTSCGSSI